MQSDHNHLRSALLAWYEANKRALPWRESSDPYRVWLSEIMLQQTRVDQALPYYHRFIGAYPTVQALARADLQQVLLCWEGLGYYSRCRNLHKAAQMITHGDTPRFPNRYEEWIALPGVGPYTAAAISSICFHEPKAVVDGNVIRVVSRYLGISSDVRQSSTQKFIQSVVDTWIDPTQPGAFNQAMMELGATVCTPHKPECNRCPLSDHCVAFHTLKVDILPYKSSKAPIPEHAIVVGIIRNAQGQLLISKRPANKMLGGLWEFPGGKMEADETPEQALHREVWEELGIRVQILRELKTLRHTYSHFKIQLKAYLCLHTEGTPQAHSSDDIRWIQKSEVLQYPFPKANRLLTQALLEAEW